MNLLGELLGLGAKGLGALDNLARDNLKVTLDGLLELLNGGGELGLVGLGLGSVATGLDDLAVVAAASTVPGEQVGGVGGDVGESANSGDGDDVLLELVGGDGGNSELRVGSRLEREVVGQETSNVGRGHGGTRDGVDGVLGADPGGLDAQARGEDVSALSVVGEVGTAVIEGRSADGNRLRGSSRGVVASIGVVVTGSDGEVDTGLDGGIDGSVKSRGLATTKRHVGDGALEALSLAVLGLLHGLLVRDGGELDALDDIGHGAGSVGSEHLDGVDVGLLGDTVLLTSNGTRAVSAVAIAVLVLVAGRDGLSPLGTTLEVDVLNVGTSVNDVGINTLTTLSGVEVLVEGAEVEGISVRDTSKTPRGLLLSLGRARILNNDVVLGLEGKHSVDNAVALDVLDL